MPLPPERFFHVSPTVERLHSSDPCSSIDGRNSAHRALSATLWRPVSMSKTLKFSMNIALFSILLATTAVAQYGDTGQYTILQARYGTERNNVDVTRRLQELARADQRFRMGNSTFGVDPDPGRVKTLRIYTRDRSGRTRTFEYREGSTVDGSQFSGWRSGNWGGGGWNGGWNPGNGGGHG